VRILPTGGGDAREVCKFDGLIAAMPPTWSADGKYVIFCGRSSDSEKWGLWRVPGQGGELEKIDIETESTMDNLTVHPDGKRIAFSSRASKLKKAELWVVENLFSRDR
jgi:Tol biopolymer transport system component